MLNKNKIEDIKLENVNGGIDNMIYYIASIFREGIDEEEVRGQYNSQTEAFDAACEMLQENLRRWPDRIFIIRIYIADTKELVYEETVEKDDYYKKIS